MNNADTIREMIREIINRYNEARAMWIEKNGEDFKEDEFHEWLAKQVKG